MNEKISRKEFLGQVGLMLGSVVVAGEVLSGCGGGGESGQQSQESTGGGTTAETQTQTQAMADPCTDVSQLTEAELTMRNQLKYVGHSEVEGQRCDNCQLYTKPEGGAPCGGCQIIKGPINPAGHCTSWVTIQQKEG
jgi:hypothetical protein